LGRLLWYVPNAESSSSYCSADLTPEDGGVLELSFGSTIHKQPFREEFNYYFTLDSPPLPLPDAPRRARVHGSENELTYRLEGFFNLPQARQSAAEDWHEFRRLFPHSGVSDTRTTG